MRRPRFIAEQARNATGLLGRIIALIMSHETKGDNRRAIGALKVASRDHVLDVGCGHGRSSTELAVLASEGKVVGVDPSDVMTDMAARRAGERVALGRVQVVTAAVEALPFRTPPSTSRCAFTWSISGAISVDRCPRSRAC